MPDNEEKIFQQNLNEKARESGDKLFTQIPYYKKQFTFIG